MSDIPEAEESGRTCDSWQSDLWAQVKDKLMKYLHHSTIFPESIPRKFDYVHKDLLMQQYNLHAAVHQPKETRTDKNINEFKSASGLGYYEVTVLGKYLVAWLLKQVKQEKYKILALCCIDLRVTWRFVRNWMDFSKLISWFWVFLEV